MLGLAAWLIFWFYLIQVGERAQQGSPLPVLSDGNSNFALRVTEAGESGGQMLEQRLISPAERTTVVEDSEGKENNPQKQELPEPSGE